MLEVCLATLMIITGTAARAEELDQAYDAELARAITSISQENHVLRRQGFAMRHGQNLAVAGLVAGGLMAASIAVPWAKRRIDWLYGKYGEKALIAPSLVVVAGVFVRQMGIWTGVGDKTNREFRRDFDVELTTFLKKDPAIQYQKAIAKPELRAFLIEFASYLENLNTKTTAATAFEFPPL